MNILEIAEELRVLAETKSAETGQTIHEVWKEVIRELDNIFEREDRKYIE